MYSPKIREAPTSPSAAGRGVVTAAFSKDELRRLYSSLTRLLPPGGRALSAEEVVDVHALADKTRSLIAASANAVERGKLLFSWRLPKDLVPTQNKLRGIKPWRLKKIKAALHDAIIAQLHAYPDAPTHGSLKPRWVRTTRFSTQEPDELSCDANGFKVAIDVMVTCGLLAEDNKKHLHREPRWEKCRPGETHGLVELFAIGDEQVAAAEPAFARVEQIVHTPGPMTKVIVGGGA